MAAEIVFSSSLGFILGIFSAGSGINFSYLLAGLTITVLVFYLFKRNLVKFAAVAAIFCLVGGFYFFFYKNMASKNYPPSDIKISSEILVLGAPRPGGNYSGYDAQFKSPYGGNVQLEIDSSREIKYGDLLKAEGMFRNDSNQTLPKFYAYNFEILKEHQGFWLKEKLLNLKDGVILELKKFLSPESSALMSGLILGERADFSKEFKDAMKNSGTTHLVALSGYNISILVVAIGTLLGSYFPRKIKFGITVSMIFLFILMVGGDPSAVRAAIMGFLLLLAKETGRLYSPRHAIAATAGAMALFDPKVIFALGFELSFVSLLGLVYLMPLLSYVFKLEDVNFIFKENFLTTVSAQMAVLPLVINYFGSFSVSSILANVFILSTVPFTMLVGFLTAFLGYIFYPLGFILGLLGELLLKYQIFIINTFANLRIPFGEFLNIGYFSLVYYFGLFYLVISIKNKDAKK